MALLSRRTLAAAALAAAAAASPLAAQGNPQLSIGGIAFAQFAAQLDSGTNSNFDVTRAYLNFIGKFNGGFMTRVTTDLYQNADGSHTYRLKYAFINWTPSGSALTYRFGLMTTPWIDWEEQLWDYRMQGPMAVDRNHYLTSSDFGAGVDGNINNELVDFQASVVDGTGYGARPGDMHKAYAARASVRLLGTDEASRVGGLRLTGYAQLGAPTGGGTRQRFMGMASYRSKAVLLAAEYAATTDSATGGAKVKGTVFSAYGFAHLPSSPVGLIARVDLVNANTAASNAKTTDLIGGLSYQLSPNIRLLADVDRLSFESSTNRKPITQLLFQTQFTY
jgi:Phosphate-selective porin O and P